MTGEAILNALTNIFLRADYDEYFYLITGALTLFGLWGLFRKSGLKGWYALIPCLAEDKLGEVAGRERDGRVVAMTRGIMVIIQCCKVFASDESEAALRFYGFLEVAQVLVTIFLIIYSVRIYLGLIEVYGQKKSWLILWILMDFLPACMWGWMKEYQPKWTVKDFRSESANYFSGSKAAVLDQGLTVNLEERTATEFFKKKYLLRDIHMYIQPGHMVLLLGGSGAGKTTFLNAVNGYEKAKAEVVLNGRNMYKNYKEMKHDIGEESWRADSGQDIVKFVNQRIKFLEKEWFGE